MMRVLGSVAVIAGSWGFGLALAGAARRECGMLRDLNRALQEMQWELKYRMTELSGLCRRAGETTGGAIREIFMDMASKLDRCEVTDLSAAFLWETNRRELPRRVRKNMKRLALSLGRYDLEGQLEGLEAVRQQCRKDLRELESDRTDRIRSYQSLALCAGVSLAILFF